MLLNTFMTELSSAMRNWPEARVTKMAPDAAPAAAAGADPAPCMGVRPGPSP